MQPSFQWRNTAHPSHLQEVAIAGTHPKKRGRPPANVPPCGLRDEPPGTNPTSPVRTGTTRSGSHASSLLALRIPPARRQRAGPGRLCPARGSSASLGSKSRRHGTPPQDKDVPGRLRTRGRNQKPASPQVRGTKSMELNKRPLKIALVFGIHYKPLVVKDFSDCSQINPLTP